ncbi:hypothetical protein SAMIE_1015780 [Sphingobium amiense]|uniref:Uncharacterized protein n=1 Tax=Sphingobium amiense TaxID=135719 RepID=A0A494W695_9SPHN|nr:hypothetical protein [Sphingobium amiense]BBD98077.1 hypothetical protein SAMIE_1015780 [Sphingobium amiense]
MSEASKAPVPETFEGLRRQNSAMRSLLATQEEIMAGLTEKGRQYQEAITTLDSERQANEILTAENIALSAEVEAFRAMLEQAWRDGFQNARNCLADDNAFELTEDVEEDAWLDSVTRTLLNKEPAR